MNTGPLQKSISRVFPNKAVASATEILFLILLGFIAIVIHSTIRIPMHLPGKQGILFIALIVMGRGLSRNPFASAITCTGSAALLLTNMFGFHDPFMAVNYILLGGILDLVYNLSTRISSKPWVIAIASGIAWMFMPLLKLTTSLIFAIPAVSFSTGIAYPFITHLGFGITGGLIGAGLLSLTGSSK